MVAAVLVFGALEAVAGSLFSRKIHRDDWIMDVLGALQFGILLPPAILLASTCALGHLIPGHRDAADAFSLPLAVAVVVLPTDLLHYWWHRKAHEWRWLWKSHAVHHTPRALTCLTLFREGWVYNLLAPYKWYGAGMVYLGLEEAFVLSQALHGLWGVVGHSPVSTHSLIYRLYETPGLRRALWVFERIFTTPDTHQAHHGLGEPRGNYAVLLFGLDVIFGTARIPRRAQRAFGIEEDAGDPWYVQLYWPIFQSRLPGSHLG